MKGLYTIGLLVVSNMFMTLAWYGHLKLKDLSWFKSLPLILVILFSWGIAFFEYMFMIPANKTGFIENGGSYNLWQLKVIQEVITLVVFTLFVTFFFKGQSFTINHLIGFGFLVMAVYFIFK
ncbi:MAG TPA: DMT family protein [Niabella sp.]|jgi:uncharacterized protein (DUF486 family)|nr:DMT family protein [Chitinophagaceae bacterium]HRO85371.1 DMT family protein [Niabella sp.]HUN03004.1 DMT family protein [Niabella sp.]